jgi:diaminohydroxyphosphoribosylaminopyrimidine deaminase / 5-amino-6-(5-phosphoribosylamino)uracil reductase
VQLQGRQLQSGWEKTAGWGALTAHSGPAELPAPRNGPGWLSGRAMYSAVDQDWMKLALRLASKGRGSTSPNPMVGAVVVNGGVVVGTGWHRRAGEGHAEALALGKAGALAEGATAYVTLEPCAHQGRTPPCVEALVQAKVARVVTASRDPDPRTAGKGIEGLRAAGIEVDEGVMERPARKLNEAYFHHRLTGRPFVTYKVAASLDGKTAAGDGSSQWITGEKARLDAHRLRADSDAICAGIGTILADDPQLTVRGLRAKKAPLRVVVDSRGRTPTGARVLSADAPTLIVTALDEADSRLASLKDRGASVISIPGENGEVGLAEMLSMLGQQGIVSMLLEGGAGLAGGFVAHGLVDKYVFYFAPKLIGGHGQGCFAGWGIASIDQAVQLTDPTTHRLGPDLRVIAYPVAS